ncbi:MAG TPA: c-type cytochrome [Luteitalea sp.]|nr:c-type cytochrome [Luteitalea sp.]
MRHILTRQFPLLLLLLALRPGVSAQPGSLPVWRPGVQKVDDASPALSPAEEQKRFFLALGYRIELVAAEPLVQDPISIDWDPSGRLWVVEIPGFMRDIAATGEHDPTGRIVVLEDTDGDGRMDRRTVFADGLVLPRTVKVLEHGVLVAEPPDVWLMRDTNGDLEADTKDRVTSEYGHREVDVENNANGFDWGLDNRLRSAGQSRLHFQWRGGTLQPGASPIRGQWGVSHDDVGRTYRNSNESALHVDLVAGEYFARHPGLLRTRGSYERLSMPDNDLNAVWPVRPTPGINRGYQAGIRRDDGTIARHTSVCTPLVVRGDRVPGLAGNVLVADPAVNLVSRIVLRDDGATVRASKGWPDAEFLASTDERFRPVYLSNAPDGAVYLVDLYRGVVEHRLSLTTYLKRYIEERQLIEPRAMGRIWRIVDDSSSRDISPVPTRTGAELVTLLSHPNGWRRDTAQRLLVERGDAAVVPALTSLARQAPDERTRLHALWTLDGLDAITEPIVMSAIGDASAHVRATAVRLAERWTAAMPDDVLTAVERRIDDADARVRLQVAATLGAMTPGDRTTAALARLLSSHADDPILVDVAISGARGAEAALLTHLTSPAARPAAEMLAATMFRGGRDADAQTWLSRVADAGTPTWQREALMHGAEIGILGAPIPGQLPPLPTATGVTCPTCPGGRQSAGGDYAFEWPEFAKTYTRPGAATPPLRLARQPEAFTRLATEATPLGKQAAAVLTRITWPGKPGDEAAPPPLTTEEQARFESGRKVYESLCQACHQPDGRGAPGRAASLVGSAIALGDPRNPIRVLLNGKEGRTGLMPPIGASLDDAQIASVLTYVRREWGHGATPVTPALVQSERAATRNRARPWTDDELR